MLQKAARDCGIVSPARTALLNHSDLDVYHYERSRIPGHPEISGVVFFVSRVTPVVDNLGQKSMIDVYKGLWIQGVAACNPDAVISGNFPKGNEESWMECWALLLQGPRRTCRIWWGKYILVPNGIQRCPSRINSHWNRASERCYWECHKKIDHRFPNHMSGLRRIAGPTKSSIDALNASRKFSPSIIPGFDSIFNPLTATKPIVCSIFCSGNFNSVSMAK